LSWFKANYKTTEWKILFFCWFWYPFAPPDTGLPWLFDQFHNSPKCFFIPCPCDEPDICTHDEMLCGEESDDCDCFPKHIITHPLDSTDQNKTVWNGEMILEIRNGNKMAK
jgi:hypothetical protein